MPDFFCPTFRPGQQRLDSREFLPDIDRRLSPHGFDDGINALFPLRRQAGEIDLRLPRYTTEEMAFEEPPEKTHGNEKPDKVEMYVKGFGGEDVGTFRFLHLNFPLHLG